MLNYTEYKIEIYKKEIHCMFENILIIKIMGFLMKLSNFLSHQKKASADKRLLIGESVAGRFSQR